jgi:hypothetical protein
MTATNTRRKKRKTTDREWSTYALKVGDWEVRYSFSLEAEAKYSREPYSDRLHLTIRGVLRHPPKYTGKELEAIFIADREELSPVKGPLPETDPTAVGGVGLRGEESNFISSWPLPANRNSLQGVLVFPLSLLRIQPQKSPPARRLVAACFA